MTFSVVNVRAWFLKYYLTSKSTEKINRSTGTVIWQGNSMLTNSQNLPISKTYPEWWLPIQRQCQCSEWQFSWWTVHSWWRSAYVNVHCHGHRPRIFQTCESPRPFVGTKADLLHDLHRCSHILASTNLPMLYNESPWLAIQYCLSF